MIIKNNVLVEVEEKDIIDGVFVVPKDITSIGTRAFYGLKNLVNVYLPENLEVIDSFAFTNCKNLEEIKFPKSLTTIKSKAFTNCYKLKEINLPESIKVLENNAFAGCTSIESVAIPNSIQKLESGVFYGCTSLKEIDLPENLQHIKSHAFAKCTSLENIHLPDSVEKIGAAAFSECSKLKPFKLPTNLTELGASAFSRCTALDIMILPNKLKKIEHSCFEHCTNLSKVSLPASLEELGKGAFFYCTALENIHIPDKIKVIEDHTFTNCHSLKLVSLSKNLTEIEEKAFYDCTILEEITIPDKVKTIGTKAFSNCLNLRFVDFPKNLIEIGNASFENCRRLTDFDLPKNLKYIQNNAFKECKALTEIIIPKGVEYIGASAFENCYSIQDAKIDCNVQFLCDNTFSGCMDIESVILPKHITSIGKKCFSDCSNLKEINLPNSLLSIDESAFEYCNLETLEIPENVENIGSYAFLKCENLKSVTLPDKLTKISNGAFQNCTTLEDINIPKSVTSIGSYAFGFNKALKSIILPEGLSKIYSSAFYDCSNLEDINIPSTVTKISDKAFEKCESLNSLEIPNNVRYFGSFREPFAFFEKTEDGFKLLQDRTRDSIPVSSLKINPAFVSRNWDKKSMLLKEQKNKNICDFYNTFLIEQSDEFIDNFLNNHNFTFFKQLNIPDVPENRYELFNALYNLGTFSTPMVKDGKKVDYAQKIVGLLLEKEKKGIAKMSDIKKVLLPMQEKGFQPEFTEFFMQEFDDLFGLEQLIPGFTAWAYNEFENVQRTNTSNRGSQRQLKPTIEKFYKYFSASDFIGITEENKHIADAVVRYFQEQKSFDKALEIDKERVKKKTPNNILGYHLEEDPFSTIDNISDEMIILQANILSDLVNTANNEFTFDWLEKNDPQNFILGKLCTCCAHLEGAGFGIMRASIVDENVQNLVIRDKEGKIVAKSTLYINPTERYGVLNNVEVNDELEGEYLPKVYEKFMLGVKTFAERYNEKFPYKSLRQITVGMHLNDLEGELRERNQKSKVLLKAIDYSIYCPPDEIYDGDSNSEQYIVWKANKQKENTSTKTTNNIDSNYENENS